MYHVSIQVRAMLYPAPRESHGPRTGGQPMGRGAEKGAYVVCPGKFGILFALGHVLLIGAGLRHSILACQVWL